MSTLQHFGFDLNLVDNSLYKTIYDLNNNKDFKSCQLSIPNFININDIIQTRKYLDNNDLNLYFHGKLTHFIAGPSPDVIDSSYTRKKNKNNQDILRELDVGVFVKSGIIFHVGSSKDRQLGIHHAANNINEILSTETSNTISYSRMLNDNLNNFKKNRLLILENSAGEGNKLGDTLDELSTILSLVSPSYLDNVKICIDTCHLSDAGQYKLGSKDDVDNFYKDFGGKIGLSKLELFHFNDSKNPFGAKRDRHEHLTSGYIFGTHVNDNIINDGTTGLKHFIRRTRELEIPAIGEFNDGQYQQDLDIINNFLI